MLTPPKNRTQVILYTVAGLILCASFLLMLSLNMQKELSHDEHMYVAAGYLSAHDGLIPYRDYPYLQMPYLPFVYAFLFQFSNNLLLTARLFSTLCATLIVAVLLCIPLRSSAHPAVKIAIGAGAVILFLSNPIAIYTSGLAWNHDLPLLLCVLAFASYCHGLKQQDGSKWVLAGGAMLGLAIGTRLAFAPAVFPFLLLPFARHTLSISKRAVSVLAPFSLSLLLSMLPVMLMFALSPERFAWDNIGYHQLNELYRQQTSYTQAMTVSGKLSYLWAVFTEPATLLLLVLFIALALTGVRRIEVALAALLLPFLLMGVLIPTPAWYQYYYAPITFLIIGVLYTLIPRGTLRPQCWQLMLFLGVAAISALCGIPKYFQSGLLKTSAWVPNTTHQVGLEVRSAAGSGKVLTVAPIYPLEGGADVYKELAAGPFTWRSAPLMLPAERKKEGVITSTELDALLNADTPAAILTGYEPDIELPFVNYARAHNYTPNTLVDGKILWTR